MLDLHAYFDSVWNVYLRVFWFATRVGWAVSWLGAAYYLVFQPSLKPLLMQPEHESGLMFLCVVTLVLVPWALWSSQKAELGT